MADSVAHNFPHRKNADGTYDSICPRCLLTVATEHDQDDLLAQEAGHVCKEEDLQRIDNPDEWLQEKFGIPPASKEVKDKVRD